MRVTRGRGVGGGEWCWTVEGGCAANQTLIETATNDKRCENTHSQRMRWEEGKGQGKARGSISNIYDIYYDTYIMQRAAVRAM